MAWRWPPAAEAGPGENGTAPLSLGQPSRSQFPKKARATATAAKEKRTHDGGISWFGRSKQVHLRYRGRQTSHLSAHLLTHSCCARVSNAFQKAKSRYFRTDHVSMHLPSSSGAIPQKECRVLPLRVWNIPSCSCGRSSGGSAMEGLIPGARPCASDG